MPSLSTPSAPPHALLRPLAARTARIAVSATSAMVMEADRLRAAGRDLVDFGVGEPDFPTPTHIKAAAEEALRREQTKYTATGGLTQLKSAICQAHARDFGSAYREANVLVTVGGKFALFNAISALVDHGDEVILPSPYWVSFRDQITYAGATPVIVAADEERGFTLDPERIAAAITPRTKLILLNSPANPSGGVLPASTFRAVLDLCRRHSLYLLSDECYARFVYDAAPYSAGAEADALPWLVIAGSLSKTYAMTGWRLGYVLADAPLIKPMLNLQSHSTSNATTFVQMAAIAALLGTQEPVTAMLAEYHRRRDVIVAGLRAVPGVECAMPAGAFYAYPNISALLGGQLSTALAFSQHLLEQAGVVTVPGEAFGTTNHLRFSYATAMPVIEEGLRRFAAFCANPPR